MAGTADWGLNDPKRNLRRATALLHNNPTLIETNKFGSFYRLAGAYGGGEFAHISATSSLITYYMKYESKTRADLGRCATQVKVWMTIAPGMTSIAKDTFFKIMLAEFNTMISDRIQTDDDRRFWMRRMAEAISNGMRVGMIDVNTIMDYDPSIDFQTWINSIDSWGKDSKHRDRLFYISNIPA